MGWKSYHKALSLGKLSKLSLRSLIFIFLFCLVLKCVYVCVVCIHMRAYVCDRYHMGRLENSQQAPGIYLCFPRPGITNQHHCTRLFCFF